MTQVFEDEFDNQECNVCNMKKAREQKNMAWMRKSCNRRRTNELLNVLSDFGFVGTIIQSRINYHLL